MANRSHGLLTVLSQLFLIAPGISAADWSRDGGGSIPVSALTCFNTGFSIGPANQYAEFFPYVDILWFGVRPGGPMTLLNDGQKGDILKKDLFRQLKPGN